MIGTYVLSHGYYDAYYLQAQKLRRMIADDFQACFQRCDVIAGPVAPTVAWPLGEQSDDPVANYLADIFTLPASLAGLPGMSIPAGFGDGAACRSACSWSATTSPKARCCTPRTPSSRRPTGTRARPRRRPQR